MPAEEIHLNDIGTIFKCLIQDNDEVQDISTASTKEIIFSKPCNDRVVKTGSFTTDGTDGYLQYVSVSGDLSETGLWKLQAHLVLGSLDIHTDVAYFRVYPNI